MGGGESLSGTLIRCSTSNLGWVFGKSHSGGLIISLPSIKTEATISKNNDLEQKKAQCTKMR